MLSGIHVFRKIRPTCYIITAGLYPANKLETPKQFFSYSTAEINILACTVVYIYKYLGLNVLKMTRHKMYTN